MKLKNLFFTLLVLVGITAVPSMAQENSEPVATSSEPLVLTLQQALEIALSENPTVQIADKTIETKKYAKKGTYAALWPEISASATYQRYIKKQTFHIMGQTMEVGTANNYSGGISAAMPVVNAQLWKSLKLSALDVDLAVEQARSSRIDMVEQVSKAFYQVLLAKDSYDVYKRVYDNAVENHKIVEKRYSVGQVSEYDFIRSQVSVANAEPNVFNAENSIVLALWQLKALLGMDLNIDIDCAGRLADYEAALTTQIEMGDLSNNSTMQQLDIQERMLEQALKVKRAANIPSLALSVNYNFTAMDETYKFSQYNWNPYSVAVVNLSIPIFSGGKRRAEIKQAKLDLQNIELQRENVERQLHTALMSYYSNMQTNVKQYHASSQTISQAKRGYEIAVKRYEVGGGTLVDVDNSQLAYTQAELSRSAAIYDYLVNLASMDKLVGNTYTETNKAEN
ncbi:MAG: TolC family protein [Rikenellaceae bacterium]|nr:TolC family protein [Rikenellaceae bacterium]